jgi:hypothetical protein
MLKQGPNESVEVGGGIEVFAGVISSVDRVSAFGATRMIPIFQKVGENSDEYKKGPISLYFIKENGYKRI